MKKGCVHALFTWLDDVLPGRVRLYSIGFERLMVENYLSVNELSKERIEINASDGCVSILGGCLAISEMRKGALIVTGSIASVAFLRRKNEP